MQKYINRKKWIIPAIALVLLLTVVVVGLVWPKPVVVNMKSPIYLTESGFGGWKGECAITVQQCTLYDSPDAASLQRPEGVESTSLLGDDVKFLVVDLLVENISAVPLGAGQDYFNIGFISLAPLSCFEGFGVFNSTPFSENGQISMNYEPNCVYFSGYTEWTEQDTASDPYFHFQLDRGDSGRYQLGFYVRERYLEKTEMALSYQINKYASRLEITDDTTDDKT